MTHADERMAALAAHTILTIPSNAAVVEEAGGVGALSVAVAWLSHKDVGRQVLALGILRWASSGLLQEPYAKRKRIARMVYSENGGLATSLVALLSHVSADVRGLSLTVRGKTGVFAGPGTGLRCPLIDPAFLPSPPCTAGNCLDRVECIHHMRIACVHGSRLFCIASNGS